MPEITETAAVADLQSAAAQLRYLIDAGIGVDLDDYGTAYSSPVISRPLPPPDQLDTAQREKQAGCHRRPTNRLPSPVHAAFTPRA